MSNNIKNATKVQSHLHNRLHGLPRLTKPALWLIAIVSFIVAGYGPITTVTRNHLSLRGATGPFDSREFVAIFYQRPSRALSETRPIDSERIAAQIDVLIANGYQPVRLTDIKRLLHDGTPLPRRALLLGVDAEDAELVRTLDSVTRRARWGGMVVTATDTLESSNAATSWRDLHALRKSGRWEIASKGHLGHATVPVAPDGTTRPHLTAREWLPDANRHESMEAFAERILSDHETAATLAQQRLDLHPIAYVFPDGNAGQYAPADDPAARINAMAVTAFYDLAFIIGPLARNTAYTPPGSLNLLPVNPDWPGQQMLDTIQQASINIETVEEASANTIAGGWSIDRGTVKTDAQGLTLHTAGEANDARIWLGGSDQLRDVHAAFQVRLGGAALRFHLMTKANEQTGLQIWFAPNGQVSLYHKTGTTDNVMDIIAQAHATLLADHPHNIEIFLRRNSIDVHVDGSSIFQRAVSLPASLSQGRLGIAMHATQQDAFLNIREVTLQRPHAMLASWNLDNQYHPFVVDQIHRNGTMLTDISPPLQLPGSQDTYIHDLDLFRKLANVYHLRLTPKLNIATDQELRVWTPDLLMRAISEQRSDGLYVSFADHTELTVPALDNWLQQVSRLLSGSGKSLLVRLPRMLERLTAVNAILAVVPTVEIVTGAPGTSANISGLTNRTIQERALTQPSRETIQNLPQSFQLPLQEPLPEGSLQEQIRRITTEAEHAFSRGAFESAIAHFSRWHELSPSSPEPLKRIGDALVNLGYHDEAVGFYRQSLDLAPENIPLAIQLARLLTETGSRASARSLLNIYARLFPQNTEILLAQADWLLRDNRRAEALERIDHVRETDPQNFEATLFALRVAEQDDDRLQAIQEIIALSEGNDGRRRLMQAIQDHDLLTLQHAYLLVAFLQQNQEQIEDTALQETMQRLAPRTTTVHEDFTIVSGLSEHWQLDGLSGSLTNQILTLQATPTRTQAEARVRRAERWRDSFIEVDLADAQGGFWIYARKAQRQLIRLGFEHTQQRLHLQIWGGPQYEVLQNHFVPWTLPANGVTLRLEAKGNGAIAYVDGKAMIEAPLELPEDFGFGWTAFTMNTPARGDASISVRSIVSGPLPFRAAIVPAEPPDDSQNDLLERMHQVLPNISDLSPEWFRIDADGKWHSTIHPEDDFYRIFARYYRLRLSPLVRVQRGANILAEDILILARTHGYNGFTLLFDQMPDGAWFNRMNQELNIPGLDVIAIAQAAPGSPATVRGIAGSSTLFPHAHAVSPINMLQYENFDDTAIEARLTEPAPALILLQ